MNLPKAARLRRRREFLQVQQHGTRLHAGDVVVIALPAGAVGETAGGRGPRIGITVSSRIGNAVVRNRVRRWVREAFRAERAEWPPVDLVVIARSTARTLGLGGVRRALGEARARLAARVSTPDERGAGSAGEGPAPSRPRQGRRR